MPFEDIPNARVTDNMLPEGGDETSISSLQETGLSNLYEPLPNNIDGQDVQKPYEGDHHLVGRHDTDFKVDREFSAPLTDPNLIP